MPKTRQSEKLKESKPQIIVILGPTATGKSDLAVKIAIQNNGEIVSADSRQVYKGLDLGSGKITKREMRGISHHMLDVIGPKTQFSVAEYKHKANRAVVDILKRGKLPIICGGTGQYMDAILYDTNFPEVKPDKKLRSELEKKSTKELFAMLKKLDPVRAENIDANNPRRLVRAIEIAKSIGEVPILTKDRSLGKYEAMKIGLDMPNEELKNRIHKRLAKRIKIGMVSEVRKLHEKGLSWKRLESLGLEYRHIALFLQKKILRDEMLSAIERESWQYVKRQRTWFKRDNSVVCINLLKKSDLRKLRKLFLQG